MAKGQKRAKRRKTNPLHGGGKKADSQVKKDMAAVRTQSFKTASVGNNPVVFFDRPGDTIEGYIDGPFAHGSLSASHFTLESNGEIVEIKAHKLLRKIIKSHELKGEYVRIEYRGRLKPEPYSFGNACPKSYYVYHGKGVKATLVPANYPPIAEPKKESAA